jgi:hypothetical protein
LARAGARFAGNVIPLLHGWSWLTPAQQAEVAGFVPNTLAANAWPSDTGTNWAARSKRANPPRYCQHCHGAPGMVTTFADAPFTTPELDALLVDAATSIVPPCCFTMMSWLIDRPSPVPSPAGLVVKNGLNIFSFTSAGCRCRCRGCGFRPVAEVFVVALSTGSKPAAPPPPLRLVAA